MQKSLLFLFVFSGYQLAIGQQEQDFRDYIARYKNIALEEMVRCGIPASITLAQGIHESNCGHSPLSREANNHFGIKCKDEWGGKKYYMDDDRPHECFRVYQRAEDSYADHSDFLVTRPRYANLFKLPLTDYKNWARGLKEAGYATNPKYAQILIGKIEEYHLDEFDRQGLAMIEEKNKQFAFLPGQTPTQTQNNVTATPVTENKPSKFLAVKEMVKEKEAALKEKEPEKKHNPSIESASRESERKFFTVNGSMVLTAQENEDPLKVAYDYNIDYSYVLQFNDLATGEHFKAGEYIFLQSKKNSGQQETYVVAAGESMRDVSQKNGIKLRSLYQKNGMDITTNEQVYAGETLNLQEKRTTAPRIMSYAEFLKAHDAGKNVTTAATNREASSAANSKITYNKSEYQVQPSDTLYSIARKFNMSVDELKALNNLQDANLQTGQKLVVSK